MRALNHHVMVAASPTPRQGTANRATAPEAFSACEGRPKATGPFLVCFCFAWVQQYWFSRKPKACGLLPQPGGFEGGVPVAEVLEPDDASVVERGDLVVQLLVDLRPTPAPPVVA